MITLSVLSCSPQHTQILACRMSRGPQSWFLLLLSTAYHLRFGLPFSNNIQKTFDPCSSGSTKRLRESAATDDGRYLQDSAVSASCIQAQPDGLMGAAAIHPRPHGALFEEAHHCYIGLYGPDIHGWQDCWDARAEEGRRTAPQPPPAPPPSITDLLPLAQDILPVLQAPVPRGSPESFVGMQGAPPPPLCPQRRSCRKSWGSCQQRAPPSRADHLFGGPGAIKEAHRGKEASPTAAPRTCSHAARGLMELGGEHLSLSLLLREKK